MTTTVLPSGQVVSSGGTGSAPVVDAPPAPTSTWDTIKSYASDAGEYMFPSAPSEAAIAKQAAQIKADNLAEGMTITDTAAREAAKEALTPGIIRQYGPSVGAGLGVMALSGGFEQKPDEPTPTQTALETPIEVPESLRRPIQNLPGVEYDAQGNIIGSKAWNPYAGISPSTPTSVATQGVMSLPASPSAYTQVPGMYQQPASQLYAPSQSRNPTPTGFKAGGIAALAKGGYPRRIGQISGPGTETSDDIPAMLSDGEFVMTAGAVRGAGNGSRREGAKKMYALMHQLEQNAARG
jgi:hypothetical protein